MGNNLTMLRRIRKFKNFLHDLREVKKYSFKEYSDNPLVWGSSERFLQLSIEILIDLGTHVIVEKEWGVVYTYRNVPEILFQREIIDEKTFKIFSDMVGFRNIIVHDYLEIDPKKVYHIIQNQLDDLENVFKILVKLL